MRGQIKAYNGAAKGGGKGLARYMQGDDEALGRYLNGNEAWPLEYSSISVDGSRVDLTITADQFEALHAGRDVDGNTLKAYNRACENRVFEVPINDPKDLDVASVAYADVREAREHARARAIEAVREHLLTHIVARVRNEDGRQVSTRVDQIMTVAASHPTSRAGDPHDHTHLMVVNRVRVGDRWLSCWGKESFLSHGAYEGIRAAYETAMYSDPELIDAMAAHGLSMDGHGQIAELHRVDERTGEVRDAADVFSKRRQQILDRYAELLEDWRANEGNGYAVVRDEDGRAVAAGGYTDKTGEPDQRTRSGLMQQAWADTRPAKTAANAFPRWEDWQRELDAAGWDLDRVIAPDHQAMYRPDVEDIPDSSYDMAALNAITTLENMHSAWSVRDVEAEAAHQVQDWNVRGDAKAMREAVDRVAGKAIRLCVRLSDDERTALPWAKGLTSSGVIRQEAALKTDLTMLADERPEHRYEHRERLIDRTADAHGLDDGQREGVRAIIDGGGLTVVEGVAGAGKTTLLKAVKSICDETGERLVVLAPTNKASNVARDEVGVDASSVAKLLYDRGWRRDEATGWRQARPGETDAQGRVIWDGKVRGPRLDGGTRLIVDEAGMLDQDTAAALTTEIRASGAHLTLMGDRQQLPAVGRGGVLDMAVGTGAPAVQLRDAHRFTDPAYADLMLRLHDRKPDDVEAVAHAIADRGMLHTMDDPDRIAQAIASEYVDGDRRTVISTDTNEQTDSVNQAIQDMRMARGELGERSMPSMVTGQRLHEGDRVMVRGTAKWAGLFNRETYTVDRIEADGRVRLVSDDHRRRTIDAKWARDNIQLGYSSTVYGAQGVTAGRGIYWAGGGSDGHSTYTALSRGRSENQLWMTTPDESDPVDALARMIRRDNGDRGLAGMLRELDAWTQGEGVRTERTAGASPADPRADEAQRLTDLAADPEWAEALLTIYTPPKPEPEPEPEPPVDSPAWHNPMNYGPLGQWLGDPYNSPYDTGMDAGMTPPRRYAPVTATPQQQSPYGPGLA